MYYLVSTYLCAWHLKYLMFQCVELTRVLAHVFQKKNVTANTLRQVYAGEMFAA